MENKIEPVVSKPKTGKMFSSLKVDSNLIRLLVILVSVTVLMSLLNPEFFSGSTFSSMGFTFPEFGIMAIATMLAMLAGGIDLSLVGSANLAGIVSGLIFTKLMPKDANPTGYIIFAIVVALAVGAAAGLFNGFNIAKVGIPPILATLGSQQLFIGLAKGITGGPAVFGFPEAFTNLGVNSIFNVIPIPLVIFAVFVIIFYIALNKTTYGLKLYLMGTNPKASAFAGVNNDSILMKTYMFCGMMAAFSGLIIMARSNSAKADYGMSYTLQVILISVLGGVNPSGGFGKISGVVLSVLILQFLSTGFTMLQFPSTARGFIWGAVLLIVMIANFLLNSRNEKNNVKKQIEKTA